MNANERNDFKNFDTLCVAVKTARLDEIEARYRCFSWEESERREDSQYDDVTLLSFRRPHKIPHKDRLQFLQVGMETELNALSRAERGKYARSTAAGLTCGPLSLAVLAGGAALAACVPSAAAIAAGCVIALAGAAAAAACIPLVLRLKKREEERFCALKAEAERRVNDVCAEARRLTENE